MLANFHENCNLSEKIFNILNFGSSFVLLRYMSQILIPNYGPSWKTRTHRHNKVHGRQIQCPLRPAKNSHKIVRKHYWDQFPHCRFRGVKYYVRFGSFCLKRTDLLWPINFIFRSMFFEKILHWLFPNFHNMVSRAAVFFPALLAKLSKFISCHIAFVLGFT